MVLGVPRDVSTGRVTQSMLGVTRVTVREQVAIPATPRPTPTPTPAAVGPVTNSW